MKSIVSTAVVIAAVLSAQPILATSSVAAQAYGDGVYGDNRYNVSPTETHNPDTPDPATGSNSALNNSTDTIEISDDTESLPNDSIHIEEPNDSRVDNEVIDRSEESESNERQQGDEEPISWKIWLAVGALVTALFLFIGPVMRRRRKQKE